MVEKFKGNNPKNARIKIDYSGVKPKVTFSYPSKKYGTTGSMLSFIYIGWIILFLMTTLILGFVIVIDEYVPSETNQSINSLNYSQCFAHYMEEAEVIANETCSTPKLSPGINVMNDLKEIFVLENLLILLLLFVPPLLIYFPFKKFWANVYPKFQGSTSSKKIAKFYPKDVKHSSEDGYYCEIPVFNNVILDYNAKEDFSKYLKLFEIEEHKFKYYKPINRKRKKKLTKKDKKERRKEMLNDYLWYAKFYFSQKPTKGSLEVIFK